jgi:hypothetical protein
MTAEESEDLVDSRDHAAAMFGTQDGTVPLVDDKDVGTYLADFISPRNRHSSPHCPSYGRRMYVGAASPLRSIVDVPPSFDTQANNSKYSPLGSGEHSMPVLRPVSGLIAKPPEILGPIGGSVSKKLDDPR